MDKQMSRKIDRWRDKQIDRFTKIDGWTDGQIDKQTDRLTDGEIINQIY